jgi:DNA-binding XRE family transcriptional regulator
VWTLIFHIFQGEVRPYSELARDNNSLRRELMQLRNRHELEMGDLSRQVHATQQSIQASEKALADARAQIQTKER